MMVIKHHSLLTILSLILTKWTLIYAGTNDPFFIELSEAASKEDTFAIDELLKRGANINSQSAKGEQTVLMQAVLHGKQRSVAHLLKKGADASIPEKQGYTPMHGAGFQGRAEIAKMLYEHGLALRDVHPDGNEPIHRACWGKEERHTETVKFFLENGVPVEEIFTKCMEKSDNVNTKKLLVDWMNNRKERREAYEKRVAKEKKDNYKPVVPEEDEYLNEDLQEAVESQDVKEMERLLAKGANINARAKGSLQTPLMFAVLHGKEKSVKFLLEKGADVTIAEKDGYTPMHGAAYQGRSSIAKILFENDVPLRSLHSDSHEPIIRACWGREKRHTDTVEFFLNSGVPLLEIYDKCMSSTSNRHTKELLQKMMEGDTLFIEL